MTRFSDQAPAHSYRVVSRTPGRNPEATLVTPGILLSRRTREVTLGMMETELVQLLRLSCVDS